MNRKIFTAGFLSVGMLLLASCSNDDDNLPKNLDTEEVTTKGDDDKIIENNLEVSISNITNLGDNLEYEGWIIVDGDPVSTGTFDIEGTATNYKQSFTVDAAQLAKAEAFVLSIEPANDTDPKPAATKILKADFSGNTASVIANLVPGLGDFSKAAGKYFLRTPTDETDGNNTNDQNGIWFGIPGAPPTAGFVGMPELDENSGWVYEGWVVTANGPISTGTFTKFDERDSGNPFSGTEENAGPPVPGEDFFLNASVGETFPLDVRGKIVVISLEPFPDNSTKPFSIKPLLSTIAQETAPASHDLDANLSSFPSGIIIRK